MRTLIAISLAGVAAVAALPVQAQVYATSVVAAIPDPGGKVPAFNAVPGAGETTWSNGLAQGVLVHGQSYNYCVSIGSGTAKGSATVSFKISRGKSVIQSDTIIKSSKFTVGGDSVWYYCSGYMVLPDSPGPATLTGQVEYYPTGETKGVASRTSASVLLQ